MSESLRVTGVAQRTDSLTGMARRALVERTTKESDVRVELDLDGTGQGSSDTGVPFFDHMSASSGDTVGST